MSISEKLRTVAENVQKVYDAGVAQGMLTSNELELIDVSEEGQ